MVAASLTIIVHSYTLFHISHLSIDNFQKRYILIDSRSISTTHHWHVSLDYILKSLELHSPSFSAQRWLGLHWATWKPIPASVNIHGTETRLTLAHWCPSLALLSQIVLLFALLWVFVFTRQPRATKASWFSGFSCFTCTWSDKWHWKMEPLQHALWPLVLSTLAIGKFVSVYILWNLIKMYTMIHKVTQRFWQSSKDMPMQMDRNRFERLWVYIDTQ